MRKIHQVQSAPKLAHRWAKSLKDMAEANRYEAEMEKYRRGQLREIAYNSLRVHLRECMVTKDYTTVAKYRTAKKTLREIWALFETTGMDNYERSQLRWLFQAIRSDRERLYKVDGPVYPIVTGGAPTDGFTSSHPYWYTNMWPKRPDQP